MKYSSKLYSHLRNIYEDRGITNEFDDDNTYLKSAFINIHSFWFQNYNQIGKIKYLMIAEAPLWGKEKKYIYNSNANNSQFFYRNDLGAILNVSLKNKSEFIQQCNQLGLLIVDISPFALNAIETKIDYKKNSDAEYRYLVESTLPNFFEPMLDLIKSKQSTDMKVFYRYSKILNVLDDIIQQSLLSKQLIGGTNQIECISKQDGNIDRKKLKQILTK